jgi:hypothetical protein
VILVGFPSRKAINVDVVMNLMSALVGVLLIPISGIVWEIFLGVILQRIFKLGTFNPLTWVATFALAVLITTLIEGLVVERLFKKSRTTKLYLMIGLGNALSVGAAFATLYIWPIEHP